MKTLLVGVDFTKSSMNAVNYTIELAKKTKSNVLLFHSIATPLIHTNSGLFMITPSDFSDSESKKLSDLQNKLSTENKEVTFTTEITYHGLKNKIEKLSKQKKISLVVIGLETKSKLSLFLKSTTSLELVGEINCPIITISKKYKQHSITKVLVAVDHESSINSGLSRRIDAISSFLDVDVEYVHVITEYELNIKNDINKNIKITTIQADTFEEGISKYVKKTHADLIMLISNNYHPFRNLFIDRHSKKIILSSQIPVISIRK